jgi:hypothetical protein
MAKEKKTRKESQILILGRCIDRNLTIRRVTVVPSARYGRSVQLTEDKCVSQHQPVIERGA